MSKWTVGGVFEPGGLISKYLEAYEMRQPQVDLALAIEKGLVKEHHIAAEGPTGCHVAGQGILMFDGSIKKVEDVVVGELLMGPSSMPRKVLSLARGEEDIVEIRPVKGRPWRVNKSHVLSLVRTNTRAFTYKKRRRDYKGGGVVDVMVSDWQKWSRTHKHIHKLFRVPVDFDKKSGDGLLIRPYHLGVLLGDGSLGRAGGSVVVTTADPEIVDAVYGLAGHYGLSIGVDEKAENNAARNYRICGVVGNKDNGLIESLRSMGLWDTTSHTKFIPHIYKVASTEDRLSLLAGLMDSDGSLASGLFDYISASKGLADDVAYVARSVGMAAYVSVAEKGCGDFVGEYWRVSIAGDVSRIPCRVFRKRASARGQKKSVLRTGFEVKELGFKAPYYGFSLSGDGRYLLDDFTVTHNTGKSLAYLVPAIRQLLRVKGEGRANNRVVVATANIALQEQLVEKDLPFLWDSLPSKFSFALVKGRNNYLCLDSYETFRQDRGQGELKFGEDVTEIPDGKVYAACNSQEKEIVKWAASTEKGDKSELPFVPSAEAWRQFAVTAEECLGSGCPFSEECFANKAKKALQEIDVIVVNYHMLFAAINVRMDVGKDVVLPPFRYLILDEAHKTADIARDFFGWTISEWVINRIRTRLAKLTKRAQKKGLREGARFLGMANSLVGGVDGLMDNMGQFYGSSRGALRMRKAGIIQVASLADSLTEASGAFEILAKSNLGDRDTAEAKKYQERAVVVADQLREAMDLSDGNGVYYMEPAGVKRRLRLVKRMLDVSDFLWNHMFEKAESVVLTSATMAIEGDCSYIRSEVGMKEGREVVVESPFDYKKQAMLILSSKAPDPKSEGYPEKVGKAMEAVLKQSDGRALGLFTSYRVLNHVAEYLKKAMPGIDFLIQGEAPRMQLVAEFREDVGSVLLGTESFWAGVDVPGEACSVVMIDKIPFPNPGDPVLDALNDKAGGQGFWQVSVPRAVLQLRQGAGRLIRRKTDRGVVIILDNRLITKGYGNIFTESLPSFRRGSTLRNGEIRSWLEG